MAQAERAFAGFCSGKFVMVCELDSLVFKARGCTLLREPDCCCEGPLKLGARENIIGHNTAVIALPDYTFSENQEIFIAFSNRLPDTCGQ